MKKNLFPRIISVAMILFIAMMMLPEIISAQTSTCTTIILPPGGHSESDTACTKKAAAAGAGAKVEDWCSNSICLSADDCVFLQFCLVKPIKRTHHNTTCVLFQTAACSNNHGWICTVTTANCPCACVGPIDRLDESDFSYGMRAIFQVYPNPALEQISINVSDFDGIYHLYIANALGQQLISNEIDVSELEIYSLNVSSLAKGIYKVVLSNGSHLGTGTFVKE